MKILFLSAWFPCPPDNGSKIRISNLLRALTRDHEVTLLTFADPDEARDEEALAAYCRIAGIVPRQVFRPWRLRALAGFLSRVPRSVVDIHSGEMAGRVARELASKDYDAVIASQMGMASYVDGRCKVARVFEEVETAVIRDAWAAIPPGLRRLRRRLTWDKTRRYVGRLAKRFSACTIVSENERGLLRQAAPGYEPIHVIPNGVDIERYRPNGIAPQPETLIFTGALTYSANFDAMQFFLSEIWPDLRAQVPGATLQITGRVEGVSLAGLPAGDGLRLTGYLPDVRPAVAAAWACVVPLRIGGGTRIKILEAMALGTPVISTPKGAEGLEVTPEEDILIADGPREFVAQTARLLRDPALRARLARNGRRLVEAKYGWDGIGGKFVTLVEELAECRA